MAYGVTRIVERCDTAKETEELGKISFVQFLNKTILKYNIFILHESQLI